MNKISADELRDLHGTLEYEIREAFGGTSSENKVRASSRYRDLGKTIATLESIEKFPSKQLKERTERIIEYGRNKQAALMKAFPAEFNKNNSGKTSGRPIAKVDQKLSVVRSGIIPLNRNVPEPKAVVVTSSDKVSVLDDALLFLKEDHQLMGLELYEAHYLYKKFSKNPVILIGSGRNEIEEKLAKKGFIIQIKNYQNSGYPVHEISDRGDMMITKIDRITHNLSEEKMKKKPSPKSGIKRTVSVSSIFGKRRTIKKNDPVKAVRKTVKRSVSKSNTYKGSDIEKINKRAQQIHTKSRAVGTRTLIIRAVSITKAKEMAVREFKAGKLK